MFLFFLSFNLPVDVVLEMELKIVVVLLSNIALLVAVDEEFHDDTFEPMRRMKCKKIVLLSNFR